MKETPEQRSRIMRAVKGADTAPEIAVRSMVHRMGYRFMLHRRDLPGKPDLVFPRLHKVIFVNGCFWHGHSCARGARKPRANAAYWSAKIERNRVRDADNVEALEEAGWRAAVVWECQLKEPGQIKQSLARFLRTG